MKVLLLLFAIRPGVLVPYEYTGYKDEILASKTTAWIGLSLMLSPVYDVKGPDAVKFLNSICVNDFSNLGDKGIRHAVICNEKGQILADGVVIKIAEDTFRTYWLNPPIDYLVKTSGMDVVGEDITRKEYFIQIAGEKSLEILEKVCECDLHDIKFATHRMAKMGNKEIRIIRLGMTGNLAYEVHGPIEDFDEVYQRIWEAGKSFGAKKLGFRAYCMSHTEGGFPNIHIHYPPPWFESDEGRYAVDGGLSAYLKGRPDLAWYNMNRRLMGSVGDELDVRFVTPYDVGWGHLVKFNHEFPGRKALEKIAQNPPRTVVTLEWNADDIAAVYATQFRGREVEPCERIDAEPLDQYYLDNTAGGVFIYRADWVMANGKKVGISTGRICSYYYNRMISLGFIDRQYAEVGKELTLIWGTPGTPQKEIRVKVARYPYIDLVRNEHRDVETIPRYRK
ncbi:MAG: aminomethyl transferase family protein [Thermoanaerobacteraceae bacterium]|nr:aminomethyl transferase family protein [Thermoanaerobacteraceae bacterium]